jgi:hypothetical protein
VDWPGEVGGRVQKLIDAFHWNESPEEENREAVEPEVTSELCAAWAGALRGRNRHGPQVRRDGRGVERCDL